MENITVDLLAQNNLTRLHSRNGPCAKPTRIIYFDTFNINPILLVGIVTYGVLLFPIISCPQLRSMECCTLAVCELSGVLGLLIENYKLLPVILMLIIL